MVLYNTLATNCKKTAKSSLSFLLDKTVCGSRSSMEGETFNTVWLSDVHLGSRACRVSFLLDFLRRTRCETLYLVGDIIDLESLRHSFFWPETHTEVSAAASEEEPGGHARDLCAGQPRRRPARASSASVRQHRDPAPMRTHDPRRPPAARAARRRFDSVIQCSALCGGLRRRAYRSLLALNRSCTGPDELLGRPYWSLAQHVKSRIGRAMRYVEKFQRASLRAAAEGGLRRRRLRPYPQGGRRRARRPALLQRRRLGRELHRARRGSARRSAVDQLAPATAIEPVVQPLRDAA